MLAYPPPISVILVVLCQALCNESSAALPRVLKADAFQHYVDQFNRDDNELYVQHIPNAAAWEFLKSNIPLLDCPDKEIEQIYYFRWWTFRKAIRQTPDGFIITEFLPNVGWAGKHNSIDCAAGHHFREGRWLHDPKYLDDYARFWFRRGGSPRSYSFWAADSLWARFLVTGDDRLRERVASRPGRKLRGLGADSPRCQRAVLADRRPRRHGSLHRRQRLPGDHQFLHVRRRPGHCRNCPAWSGRRTSPRNSAPRRRRSGG